MRNGEYGRGREKRKEKEDGKGKSERRKREKGRGKKDYERRKREEGEDRGKGIKEGKSNQRRLSEQG